MLYVVAADDGALLGWASTLDGLPPAPPRSTILALDAWDAPPPPPWQWSPVALDWVLPAPAPVSRLAFRWRYTLDEQIAVTRAEAEWPDPDVRATLRILRESLAEADGVALDDPRTVQGVMYHATLGLITDARAAEILTP
jgi:hypothetical protein